MSQESHAGQEGIVYDRALLSHGSELLDQN